MPTYDVFQPIVEGGQEVAVGVDDLAIKGELDHRLNLVDRLHHASGLALVGDVDPFDQVADRSAGTGANGAYADRKLSVAEHDFAGADLVTAIGPALGKDDGR